MHKFCALLGITLIMSVSTFAIADEKTSDAKSKKIPERLVPEMVDIPAGSFMMGNINHFKAEGDWAKVLGWEQPVHKVNIKAFRLGKYEVTFEQYDAFAEATSRPKPNDEGSERGQLPVGNVTWLEAIAYTEWLSQQTGKKFRLASEAEWQYAARAGTTTEYYWGDKADHNFANYGKDEGCCDFHVSGADKWLYAAPVGQFPPNKFGLYDMLGNVSELVQDCKNTSYEGSPTDGSAWTTGDCSSHVTLGGQFHGNPFMLRVSGRNFQGASDRFINFGFRVAQDIE